VAKGKKTGGGSRKGVPNKITADIRAMVTGALTAVGGQKYLEQQAQTNPNGFLTLVGKCLPKEITGADGTPLVPGKIVLELVEPA
jgi:hypothetical protein